MQKSLITGGMLGLEFLSKFEVEFDFVNKAMRFHSPGCMASGALDVSQLVEIPMSTHPTGLKTAGNGGYCVLGFGVRGLKFRV
jgi:hypothetical protein